MKTVYRDVLALFSWFILPLELGSEMGVLELLAIVF